MMKHPVDFVRHLRELASRRQDEVALVAVHAEQGATVDRPISYGDLDARVRALAVTLQRQCAIGDRVLIVLDNGDDYVVSFFACLYAGMVAVPVFPPESTRAQHLGRLSGIATDAQATCILTHGQLAAGMSPLAEAVHGMQMLYVDQIGAEEADRWIPCMPQASDLAFLQYTSGSTSAPKGVMVTHGSLMANMRAIEEGLSVGPDDVFVSWLPLNHDMGLIGGLLQPIHRGIPVVLMSPRFFLERPVRWLEAISRHRGTISGGPDFAYRLCLERVSTEQMGRLDLSSWGVAFSGAEPVRADTFRAFAEHASAAGFSAGAVYPCYGLAEATLFVTGGRRGDGLVCGDFDADELALRRVLSVPQGMRLVGCGRTVSEHAIRIVDPESCKQVDAGHIGEIWACGPSLARGYWEKREASQATFVELDGRTWLRTGDLGFEHDGQTYIAGRIKDMIIVRGQNLYPQDLERAVEAEVEAVRKGRVAAFSVQREEGGEGIGLAAEVSRGMQKLVRPQQLVEALGAAVSEVCGEPLSVVLLLNPGGMPKTTSGKLQRSACRQGWLDGSADAYAVWAHGRFERGDATALANTSQQAGANGTTVPDASGEMPILMGMWRQVLRLREDRQLDRSSHFFHCGGNSLLATQLAMHIQAQWRCETSVRMVFDHPRLGDMLDRIRRLAAAGTGDRSVRRSTRVPSIVRRPDAERAMLSAAQKRQWFLWRLDPKATAYHVGHALRLNGALNADAMREAFRDVVCRHEALRTVCRDQKDGEVEPRVLPESEFAWLEADLCAFDPDRRDERLDAMLKAQHDEPFDLTQGPLLRVALIRVEANAHVLSVVMHHIVSDGASMQILLDACAQRYLDRLSGTGGPQGTVSPALLQYADYAAWQQDWLDAGEREHQLAWWRAELGDEHPVLALPADHPRRSQATHRAGCHQLTLPGALTSALRGLADSQGVSLFMLMLAGFQALLFRYTGQPRIRLGVPVANRHHPGTQDLIGFFANTLVMQARPHGRMTWRELLAQARESVLAAQSHQDLPFEQLVEALQPERSLSHTPLFQVAINHLVEWPLTFSRLPGVSVMEHSTGHWTAPFELTLDVRERADGEVTLAWRYAADLFEPDTMARMAQHLLSLLAAAPRSIDVAIDELPMLADDEKARLTRLGDPEVRVALPPDVCLHRMFEACVERGPDRTALIHDTESVTYARLNAEANRLARRLARAGIGRESKVGVALERSTRLITTLLAVLKAGAAYVPLDPAYPAERLSFMAQDGGIAALVTERKWLDRFELPDAVTRLSLDDLNLSNESSADLAAPVHGEQLAYVIYTSGSTGKPKGAQLSHLHVTRLLQATQPQFGFGPDDTWTLFHSYAFDFSVWEIFGALCHGGRLVIVPHATSRAPREMAELLRRHGVTVLNQTPSAFRQLMQVPGMRPSGDLKLRLVIFGGEELEPETLRPWLDRFGDAMPELVNMYGITETTVHVTSRAITAADLGLGHRSPIGKALPDLGMRVLDGAMNLVPIGVPGELHVSGAGLARGYLHRAAMTAQRFVADPFDPAGGRLYRTGDLVRWGQDGELEYLGRLDHQVKIRGFRIEIGEIESQLLAQPGVREALVLVRDGVAGPCLAAFVTGSTGAPVDAPILKQAMARVLPDYMVPASITVLDAFPLNANGKVDRKALPDPVALAGPYAPPKGKVEETVAGIWSGLLRIDQVGRHDNFFEIGGHSLLLMKVQSRLETQLGMALSVVDLFQHPTVERLAAFLCRSEAELAGDMARQGERRRHARSRRHEAPGDQAPAGLDIAIVGMAGRFPGAADVDAFWRNVRDGVESVTLLGDDELLVIGVPEADLADGNYVKAAVRLDGMGEFDAGFFGYSPREASRLDPQQRLFLEAAWQALEHAGHGGSQRTAHIGVYAGSGASTYLLKHLLPGVDLSGAGDIASMLGLLNGNDKDSLATRTAYKLGLRGPAIAVQTACSTSLVAVHMACASLLNGETDMALAGGVWLNLMQEGGYRYQNGAILSRDGHCRAFDAQASGTVIGSGVGVVVLKRLSDALADGDTVHAVIKGSALNNDGANKVGYTAPSVEGQADVVRAAQAVAGVDADAIGYVEAHGTGTTLGDPIEIAALTQAFRSSTQRRGYCAIGSVKTNIGHLDAAAGVTGLIKAVMALKHRTLPPSLNFERPNPHIDFEHSPFFVNTVARPWVSSGAPRLAGVSSFGMGGTNAHVILEEAPRIGSHEAMPDPAGIDAAGRLIPLMLSARSASALGVAADRLAAHLDANTDQAVTDVAWTLHAGRQGFEHRAVVLARDREQASQGLRQKSAQRFIDGRVLSDAPGVVFLFPGQGSQHPAMGRTLYRDEPVFREVLDQCSELLMPHLGADLRTWLYPEAGGEAEAGATLARTAFTQPALFAVSYAMARLWMSWGVRPEAMMGHSIGEYVAACLAGVFTLEEALEVVALRGRLLQQTAPGAMLAVGLDEASIRAYLSSGCDLAAVNAADMCVLSGSDDAIGSAEHDLRGRGVMARRLLVSHAFHSERVEPMLAAFSERLSRLRLRSPSLPFISNLSGTWITDGQAISPAYWVEHVRGTVRFASGLDTLLERPDRILLEVGPGETLTSLAKRHHLVQAGQRTALASQCHPNRTAAQAEQAPLTLARLWVAGVSVDLKAYMGVPRPRRVPLPTYPFERQTYWIDAPARGSARMPRASAGTLPQETGRGMDDWFYAPVWTRRDGRDGRPSGVPPQRPGGVLMMMDTLGVAVRMGAKLSEAGRQVIQVVRGDGFARLGADRFQVRAGDRQDFERLLRALGDAAVSLAHVCHLWCLDAEAAMPDRGVALAAGFHSLMACMRAWAEVGLPTEQSLCLTVIANQVEDVGGTDRVCPEKAALHGARLVIPQEFPHVRCRMVDVAPARMEGPWREQMVSRLLADLACDDEAVVALRGSKRWVKSFEAVQRPVIEGKQRLRKRGVYLVTGGLGGVGLALARYLAQAWDACLVLVSRMAVPARDTWEACLRDAAQDNGLAAKLRGLIELENLGAQVLIRQADVTDLAQVRGAVDAARQRFGRIDGVIHAAGEAGGGLIARRDAKDIAKVFSAKVEGARNLMAACQGMPLDFMLLCSALTAVVGGIGQCDYGAANAVLDAMAADESGETGFDVIPVNWDVWRDVGMAAGQRLPDGVGIAPSQGGELLARILCGPAVQTLVSTVELDRQIQDMGSARLAERLSGKPAVRQRHARPALDTPYVAPAGDLEEDLVSLWDEFLGISGIGVQDNLFELGGDSLLAIQLLTRVSQMYGVEIHPASLFKTPTVAALAVLIETRLIEEFEKAGANDSVVGASSIGD